jgi:hypothetical protein
MTERQDNPNTDRAVQEPKLTTEALTELHPGAKFPHRKGSFRRTQRGKIVMGVCAQWVVERLNASGLTFDEWLRRGAHLRDIGINKAAALSQLQPRIPAAHQWYSESGEGRQFDTWEEYWSGQLSNRLYYFFRKHVEGRIVSTLAEWPGRLENGVLIAPEISDYTLDDGGDL